MRLHSIRIKNYKCLKDVTLTDLPPFCAFIGANGAGKSTLFDALSFVSEMVFEGVQKPLRERGGYYEVVSSGEGDASLEFYFDFSDSGVEFRYEVEVSRYSLFDVGIQREVILKGGDVAFDRERYKSMKVEDHSTAVLLDVHDLLHDFPGGGVLKEFFGGMALSHLAIPALRGGVAGAFEPHLTPSGDNLPRVALLLQDEYPDRFSSVVKAMGHFVPGLERIEVRETEDSRVILKFGDGSFTDPFLDRNVSDGTMKIFAYLVMLYAPEPHALLCVEEPENYLYPTIQKDLAEEFRAYANRGGQVFVSTHSPDFLNALNVEEVVWLVKENGFTKAVRAKDDPQVVAYMKEGDRMGYLWKEGFFKGVHP